MCPLTGLALACARYDVILDLASVSAGSRTRVSRSGRRAFRTAAWLWSSHLAHLPIASGLSVRGPTPIDSCLAPWVRAGRCRSAPHPLSRKAPGSLQVAHVPQQLLLVGFASSTARWFSGFPLLCTGVYHAAPTNISSWLPLATGGLFCDVGGSGRLS